MSRYRHCGDQNITNMILIKNVLMFFSDNNTLLCVVYKCYFVVYYS